MSIYQAWKFLAPDDQGLRLSARGAIDMSADESAIRQALFLLLSTDPGERVMRPGYGCRLRDLVFSPNDETTAGLAIHYVRQAIERWEPRIEILRLDAGANPDFPERLEILVEYRIRATSRTERLTYTQNLQG